MATPHQPDQTSDEQTNLPGRRGITAGQNVQHSILVTGDNNQVIFESVPTQRVTQSARHAIGGLCSIPLQEYHVFLASPSDVNEERTADRRFFDQYNRNVARPNWGVQFMVIDWENYATVGVVWRTVSPKSSGYSANQKMRLIKELAGDTVLVEYEFPWRLGGAYKLSLQVEGTTIRTGVDGRELFVVANADRPPEEDVMTLVIEEGRVV